MITPLGFSRGQDVSRHNLRSRKNRSTNNKNTTQITLNSSLQTFNAVEIPQQVKQCRICLDGIASQTNQLIKPCNCTGSVGYVHQDCFKQWIMKQYDRQSEGRQNQMKKDGFKCEICKCRIYLQFNIKRICNNVQEIKQKIKTSAKLFIFILLCIIIQLFSISYMISHFNLNNLKFSKNVTEKIVYLILIIIALIFLIILIIIFAKRFLTSPLVTLQRFNKDRSLLNSIKSTNSRKVHNQLILELQ